jgi:hypothetical protein
MDITEAVNQGPFRPLVDVEVTEVADGYAEGRLDHGERHSSNLQTVVG